MSAYEVSLDHIGFLVNLGHVLAVRGVAMSGNYQRLNLDDEHDRAYVANELIAQNRTSVGFRYRDVVVPVIGNPRFRFSTLRPVNLAQLAQALQWVRCYQYQSCEDPAWNSTFAYHFTERLRHEIDCRIVSCFATSWDYDGEALVDDTGA